MCVLCRRLSKSPHFSGALPKASMFLQDMYQYCDRLLSRLSVCLCLTVCLSGSCFTRTNTLPSPRLQKLTRSRIRLKTKNVHERYKRLHLSQFYFYKYDKNIFLWFGCYYNTQFWFHLLLVTNFFKKTRLWYVCSKVHVYYKER